MAPTVSHAPLASAWRWIRGGLHLLTVFLLGLAVLAPAESPAPGAVVVVAGTLTLAVYAAGQLPAVRRDRRTSLVWLAALVACWLVLMGLTPDGVWLAFPLFFLAMHLLSDRAGAAAVAALTIAAVAGFGWHQHELTAAMVIGPTLGALVAVGTVLGLRTIGRESGRRGVLEERERLAREIHDTLTQGLSSIHLLLGAAEGALPRNPEEAAPLVARAREAARENLVEARRFVQGLAPADLADGSLPAALRRLTRTRTVEDGPSVTFDVSGEPRQLPTPYDVALLRIAQSALANALTHGAPRRVAVTLTYMDHEVALDVVDDGRGFDPEDEVGQDGGGFGIAAMRSRADQLGGALTVESAPGAGTAVAVSLPLREPR